MRRHLFFFPMAFLSFSAIRAEDVPHDVPVSKFGDAYRLIGLLNEPFGTVVTVQGVYQEPHGKGGDDQFLQVERINGKATQKNIRLWLRPYSGNFGEVVKSGESLPKLEDGTTYELEGFETGAFEGIPKAYDDPGKYIERQMRSQEFHFSHHYAVRKGKKIKENPALWPPAEFINREAMLEGRAVSKENQAYIVDHDWQLLVNADKPWPKGTEGKAVEGFGIVRKTNERSVYRLEKGTTRLVKLEDQLAEWVSLRGTAWSMNGEWWFVYRGTELYVEGMKDLPKWSSDLHGAPVLIAGILQEEMLPDIGQITLKTDRDKKKYFIVRKPSWKPIEMLLSPERIMLR